MSFDNPKEMAFANAEEDVVEADEVGMQQKEMDQVQDVVVFWRELRKLK